MRLLVLVALPSLAFADRAMEPPMKPTPPPAPVGPAPEIAKVGKATTGTYKCKGNTMRGDGSSTPLVATVAVKLDLDNAWIQTTLAEDSKTPLRFTEYRTYDPVAKQWTRIQLVNTSGHVQSTSLGEQNGKWTWEGAAVSPAGTLQLRDYEECPAGGMHLWGEALLGGTWQKLYEVTCKK